MSSFIAVAADGVVADVVVDDVVAVTVEFEVFTATVLVEVLVETGVLEGKILEASVFAGALAVVALVEFREVSFLA